MTKELKVKEYKMLSKAVLELAAMNKKKISEGDILLVAKKHLVSPKKLKKAWITFQETGGKYISRKYKKLGEGTEINAPLKERGYTKRRDVTAQEAGKILVEYMTSEKNSRTLSREYKVSLNQIYEWIHELNVKGTILNKKILDPKKYYKLDIKDVIWYRKKPDTKRKTIVAMTLTEKAAMKRVATVLEKYLLDAQ